jgi:predicted acetyltransferase
MSFALIRPDLERLPGFLDALRRSWSPDNVRGEAAASELLAQAAEDPAGLIAGMDDLDARGGPIILPDGSTVERLPGFHRWLWDGDFCGVIGFRWRPGTAELPPHVLGHVGYAVVPWKRGQGYATQALAMLLEAVEGLGLGLPWVELTTDTDNIPSQNVILNNGGWLVGPFRKAPAYGGGESLRYRIDLSSSSAGT